MPIVKRPPPQMPTPTAAPKMPEPMAIEIMKARAAESSSPAAESRVYQGSPLGAIAQTIDGYKRGEEEKKRKEMAALLRGAQPPNPWMPVVTKKG